MKLQPSDREEEAGRFLAPINKILANGKVACEVYWKYPNEQERNTNHSMPAAEVFHYLQSMIYSGFYAAVRLDTRTDPERLEVTLWEEFDGEFKGAQWPDRNGLFAFESVWSGFSG